MEDPSLNNPYDPDESILPYTQAVGAVCIEWVGLEKHVAWAVVTLSGMKGDPCDFAIVRCYDFRDQLAALKVAAVARMTNPECLEAWLAALDYVDNVLRPRRNRYVHDLWHLGFCDLTDNVIRRQNLSPKVFRPQSRQPLTWAIGELIPENLAEMHHTIWEVIEHAGFIEELSSKYELPNDDPSLRALLQTPPQRRFLSTPHENSRSPSRAQPEPPQPPSSSNA